MLVPSTGKRRSLKAIVHAVDPYDMPAGLRLSCRWYEPVENSTLEYEYTLDDSARYEGTCFLSFVNLAYDQQQGVYRLSGGRSDPGRAPRGASAEGERRERRRRRRLTSLIESTDPL